MSVFVARARTRRRDRSNQLPRRLQLPPMATNEMTLFGETIRREKFINRRYILPIVRQQQQQQQTAGKRQGEIVKEGEQPLLRSKVSESSYV